MKKLRGFSLPDYQHDGDKAALVSLQKVKALEKAVGWVINNTVEKVIDVQQIGSNLSVKPEATPELYAMVMEVANTLDIKDIPQIYLHWDYNIYITTDGDKHPKMIVNSGVADLLTKDEQRFIIGHEFGHIKSNHLKYLLLCRYWSLLGNHITGTNLLRIPLMVWSRKTDFTADRVGLLACQDIKVAIRTMIKMAGAPKSMYESLDVDAFIRQAEDFSKQKEGIINGAIEKIMVMDNAVPWMVRRAAELLQWYNSGEYDKLLCQYGV